MNEVNCPNCKDSHTRDLDDQVVCLSCGYNWVPSTGENNRDNRDLVATWISCLLTDQRRRDTHCPHCDSTNLFVSTMTEGGYLCLDCRYGFVDQRKS